MRSDFRCKHKGKITTNGAEAEMRAREDSNPRPSDP